MHRYLTGNAESRTVVVPVVNAVDRIEERKFTYTISDQDMVEAGALDLDEMPDAIERGLGSNQWLGGNQPSRMDANAHRQLGELPDAETNPSTFAWYILVGRFSEAVRRKWPAN